MELPKIIEDSLPALMAWATSFIYKTWRDINRAFRKIRSLEEEVKDLKEKSK